MSLGTLHAPAGSFRAFSALIAAEYNGVNVDVASDFDSATVASLSPTGKAPILQLKNGQVLFSSHAIARYVASVRSDLGLYGQNVHEKSAIDSWMDYSSSELELPCCVWTYPVLGYMPFHKDAYEKAKADVGRAFSILDQHLLNKTYVVGDQITLADIVIASTLLYPMKLVCTKDFLKPYGNVVRWFNTCVNQPQFANVMGTVTLAKTEMTAPGQDKPKAAAGKGGDGGGGGKKKDKKKKEAAAAPPPAPKKVEHPYKIMDKEKPSKFSMDAWKKTYSNAKTYDEAMKIFWETFDKEGWTIWLQTYNYNEDNKRAFMAANAVGGFQQRTDEIRRWAFGVMDVLGTEETTLEICGMWLLRGDTVDHMKNANDDANWYTWKKLAGPGLDPTDDVKKQVAAYWCSEEELEGKPIQDSKVFK